MLGLMLSACASVPAPTVSPAAPPSPNAEIAPPPAVLAAPAPAAPAPLGTEDFAVGLAAAKTRLAGCVVQLGPVTAPGKLTISWAVNAAGQATDVRLEAAEIAGLVGFAVDLAPCVERVIAAQPWPPAATSESVRLDLTITP